MTHAKRVLTLFLSGALLCAAAPARAVVDDYQTLELVRTYASEEEFQAANAKMLREKHPIVDDGEFITFLDPETGNVLKQIKKEQTFEEMMANLTETERQQMADPENTKTLIKTFQEYLIPSYGSSPYLQIREYETVISEHQEGESNQKLIKSTVYNRQGEAILNLPLDVNAIALAPNEEHLIGYSTSLVNPGESLYFYDIQGKLLQKQPFPSILLNINFSSNGECIAIHSEMEDGFYIFTKRGEVIFKGSYLNYVKEHAALEGVFVSDDGNSILLNTSNRIFLLDRNGIERWNAPIPTGNRIHSASFDLDNQILYISTNYLDLLYTSSGWLRILKLDDGNLVGEMNNLFYYSIGNNTLYINQGGRYEEFLIK